MYKITLGVLLLWLFYNSATAQPKALADTAFAPQTKELEGVTITAWRNALHQRFYKAPDLQVPVDKLLENINGVTMIRRGNFAMEPTVRGLSAGQINTTIDGMHIFGACTDRMDPVSSYVEPNNLKSIQVGFSPNEEQFGASIGGGFNFKLQKAVPDTSKTFSGLAGMGYETNGNALQTLASLQFSKKKFALGANAVFRKANNYTAGGGEKILFSQYNKWNLGLNGTYLLSSHHQIVVDYLQDEGYDIGYPALTMDVAFAKAKMGSVSHVYSCHHRKLYQWETKVYANYIDHAMDDTKRPASQVPMHMDMPGTSSTMGFYSKASWNINAVHNVSAKINAYRNRLHAEMTMYPPNGAPMFMLTIPDAERIVAGIEMSDRMQLSKHFMLSAGATFNYAASNIFTDLGRQTLSSIFTDNLNRKQVLFNAFLQANYKLNSKVLLYGGIAKGARSASLQELYAFYLYNRLDAYDYLGSNHLKTEQSWNANLGLTYSYSRLQINPQLYLYYFNDYIVGQKKSGYSTMTIGASGVKQYVNIPHALLWGAELTAQYKILANIKFTTQNSVSYGVDNLGDALVLIPPFKSVNKVNYDLKGFAINVTAISQAKQNRVSPEKYGEQASKGFTILNAGVGKDFVLAKMKWNANLSMENILDGKYYEHLDIMKINRPGRNFIFHLTVMF